MKDTKDFRLIVRVQYDGCGTKFTFRCRSWHFAGDKVTVFTKGEYKVVTVVECEITTETHIRLLAYALGYSDLKDLYCKQAIKLAS